MPRLEFTVAMDDIIGSYFPMETPPNLTGVFAWDYDPTDYAGMPLRHWQYFPTFELAAWHAGYHKGALTRAFSKWRKLGNIDGIAEMGGACWVTAKRAFTPGWWDRSNEALLRVFPHLMNRAPK